MTANTPNDFQQDAELISELLASFDPESDLFRFAQLLKAGIDAIQNGENNDEEANRLSQWIADLRSWVENENSEAPTSFQQAEALWGNLVETDDSFDVEDEWDRQDGDAMDQVDSAEEDFSAPSVEQIQSLMQQLQPATSPETHETEPVANTNPSIESNPEFDQAVLGSQSRETASSKPTSQLSSEELDAAIKGLDSELREAFLEDAVECVGSMEAALLKLGSEPNDQASIQQILRELHTLKGASASVGLTVLADRMHQLEDQLREDQSAGNRPDVDLLLQSVDVMTRAISGDEPPPPMPTHSPAAPGSVNAAPVAAPAPTPTFNDGPADDETVRVKASQLNRLMDMLAELVMLRNRRDTELQELQEVYHELIGSVSKMRLLSNEERSLMQINSSLQLSEVANDVLEVAQSVRDCARPVADGNAAVSQFIRQFRQELVELRRTPISGLFQRLQRAVRDAAQAESKEVELRLVGEQAGIERTLQQRLYEPLLHIVRNSVCHGIETAEQRHQSGKAAKGVITIEAKSGPDLLIIEIRDDGRGLDYDAIRRRGIERGLLSPNQAASEEELAQLIFQPGFSTRQEANQVAGRGVGMDVVASTLQRMRGWLEVDSVPGQGTRIRLSFPLPSLVQHAMVFRSGDQLFALPMQSVLSAGQIDPHSMHLRMSDLIKETRVEDPQRDIAQTGIVLAYEPASGNGTTRVTLIVDEIVGPEEVVARPLPALLKQHPFCAGATLSGLAQTVLLLDARRMVESEMQLLRPWQQTNESIDVQRKPTRPVVLVADDSLSARRRVVRSLSRYPVEIVEASDGKQALQKLQAQHIDAVFSDMEMPHLSGMDLLSAAGEIFEKAAPPIVIVSSRNEPEFTDRARELGAVNYLFKPLEDDDLDQTLQRLDVFKPFLAKEQSSFQPSGVTA
ncbi:MAG: response regulator [Planctomycetota bacterium]